MNIIVFVGHNVLNSFRKAFYLRLVRAIWYKDSKFFSDLTTEEELIEQVTWKESGVIQPLAKSTKIRTQTAG